jgi:hypothetical protein
MHEANEQANGSYHNFIASHVSPLSSLQILQAIDRKDVTLFKSKHKLLYDINKLVQDKLQMICISK